MTSKVSRLAIVLGLAVVIVLASAVAAFAVTNNNIGTAIPIATPLPMSVYLDGNVDPDFGDAAVYSVYLNAGDTLFAGVTEYYGFYLLAYGPTATDINLDTPVEWMPSVLGDMQYVAPVSGTYYLAIQAFPAGDGEAAAVGTAQVWAGAQRKTTTSVLTTYETLTSSKTTASTSIVIPFNSFASFDGTVSAAAGGVEYEPVGVLRQFAGQRQTKIGNVWTFGEADAGYFGYVPFPVDGIQRKVTYTFQFAGTDPETATAEGYGFSYGQVTLNPYALLTPASGSTTVYHGRTYTYTGILAPRHTSGSYGVKLYCERYESGKWRLRKTVSAKLSNTTYTNQNYLLFGAPASKYTGYVNLPYAGKWRIRAYHSDTDHYPTWASAKGVTAK